MKEKTAVEWFFDNLKNHEIQAEHFELYIQAKAINKEQILNACNYFADYPFTKEDSEEYYNETYNK